MNKTIIVGSAAATCIQASECTITGKPIFTFELEYPRPIHAQLLTHKMFSKNSSSTRAVPLEAAIQQIIGNPAQYLWTANQSGMQGAVVTDMATLDKAEGVHLDAMTNAIASAREHAENGIHKQNAGRLLEPFQNIKIVLTATEFENWDWLRIHEDAQGEIADLARAMKEARDTAEIMLLNSGEWHVPYVERVRLTSDDPNYSGIEDEIYYCTRDDNGYPIRLTVDEAKLVSSSVCAQISYRKADTSLIKAVKMRGMLIDGHKVHASPFEHQATPISPYTEADIGVSSTNDPYDFDTWEKGITHIRRDGTFGSGNFIGWVQHRQLIPRHDKAMF